MRKKILIATGGTGGHIFPALSVAEEIIKEFPETEIQFIGHGLEKNSYFPKENFSFSEVSSSTLSSKNPFHLTKGIGLLSKGVWKAFSFIKKWSPDLILGFGSYHTLPVLLAATIRGTPFILHEANAIPGRINRLFASRSVFIGTHFPSAQNHLRGNSRPSPLPLRQGYDTFKVDKEEARIKLHLQRDLFTFLIFGGSQGASALNQLFETTIPLLKNSMGSFQVIHLVGRNPEELKRAEACYRAHNIPSLVAPFLADMRYPLRAADLGIVRSGANTIAELSCFSLPAIFLPYPHSKDQHQEKNGLFISREVGGGKLINQMEATPSVMAETILSLLLEGGKPLEDMRQALKDFESTQRTASFKNQIIQWLNTTS